MDAKVDDLTDKAIKAIKESVANNSVKSGEIDALVQAIENRLYQDVLRKIKADLAKSPPAAAS